MADLTDPMKAFPAVGGGMGGGGMPGGMAGQEQIIPRGRAQASLNGPTARDLINPDTSQVTFGGTAEDYIDGEGYQLAARVEGLFDESMRARTGMERMWFEAASFYIGQQWCVWDGGPQILRSEGRAPSWAIRRTLNKIKPKVQHAMALILGGTGANFACIAPSVDGEDQMASETADATLRHFRRLLRYDRLDQVTLKIACIMGTAARELEFDQYGGGTRPARETDVQEAEGQVFLGQDGVPMRFVGRPRTNLLTPFNLVPDPKATGDDDGEFLFTIREVDLERLKRDFPKAAPYLTAEEIGASHWGLHYLNQWQAMAARYNWGGVPPTNRRSALLKTLYMPQSARYPEGRRILVANHVLLDADTNPVYRGLPPQAQRPRARWPVFVYRWDHDGVAWWGRGLVPDLIDPQKDINQLISKADGIVHSMSNPKWVLPKINDIKVTDKPGEVIRYPHGQVNASDIAVIHGAELPMSIITLINVIDAAMEETAGIRSATAGEQPSARASGRQISQLIQQDASRLSLARREFYESSSEEMAYMLELVRRYHDPDSLIQLMGGGQNAMVEAFSTADIISGTDVSMVTDSRLPEDPESRSLVLDILSRAGFMDPRMNPDDKQMGLELMGVGSRRKLYETMNADQRKATRENVLMSRGYPPDPDTVDHHDVHIKTHADFQKTEKFRRLDATTQSVYRSHLQWHLVEYTRLMAPPPGPGAGPQAPPGSPEEAPQAAVPGTPGQPQ